MRTVFIISFVINVIFTVVALVVCPGTIAIHFGAGGDPNGWAPAYVNALIMSGVDVLIFVSFFFSRHLMRITPSRFINLPNKQYWLKEENRGRMESMLISRLYQFGTMTFIFMFIIGLLTLQANLSTPVRLREDLFWWPFGIYMAYATYWTIHLMLIFRVPKEELGEQK